MPELERAGLPAAVFVASDAVGRREPFWREALAAAWRGRRMSPKARGELWRAAGGETEAQARDDAGLGALADRLATLPLAEREELLGRIVVPPAAEMPPAMLGGGTGPDAARRRHPRRRSRREPLDVVADPWAELDGARRDLARLLGEQGEGPLALSFSHGRHGPELRRLAREAGYELLFTSDEHLNTIWDGRPPRLLGRIPIDGRQLAGAGGGLRPEFLAAWLFARPRRGEEPGSEGWQLGGRVPV